nr:AlNc14C7G936 [Albugo laibachii Nc14]|eukprot:CCA14897.1 AlNc14C7G936 [Albugo laibachii Nc14]
MTEQGTNFRGSPELGRWISCYKFHYALSLPQNSSLSSIRKLFDVHIQATMALEQLASKLIETAYQGSRFDVLTRRLPFQVPMQDANQLCSFSIYEICSSSYLST